MTTTVTVKGQVTLPKKLREAVGIKPGDKVDMLATAAGGIVIRKPGTMNAYKKRIREVARRRTIRGMTTDEIMLLTRGDPADDYKKRK